MTSIRTAIFLLSAATTVCGAASPILSDAEPPEGTAPPADAGALPRGAIARIGTTQLRQLSWHKRVFFAPDSKCLLVTDDGDKVRWWDPVSGRLLHELRIPNSRFDDSDLARGPGLLAAIGVEFPEERPTTVEQTQQTVWLIDTADRKVIQKLRMPEIRHSVRHKVRFTPDGKRVVGAVDGELRIWDVKTGDELIRWKGRVGTDALAVSPDGKTIAFGRHDVYLWRWESGEEPRKTISIGNFGTELIDFAPDGKLYVMPLAGGQLKGFDVPSGRQLTSIDIGGPSRGLSFSPDGTTLAVGYAATTRGTPNERYVTLWDVATGAERMRLPVGQMTAEFVSWSPDGTRLAAASTGRLWVWDVKTGQPLCGDEPGHEAQVNALTFGPDGLLFTACEDRTVRSWDATTGRAGLVLLHDAWVDHVAVSPDGALVAASALRNDLRIWDAKTGQQRFRLRGNGESGGRRRVGFTADGTRLVAWGDDEYLRVWDMRNGKLLAETQPNGAAGDADDPRGKMMRMERSFMSGYAISPDGAAFALGSGTAVRVVDPMTGKEKLRFEVGPTGATQLDFSPDGKRLAVAGRGKPTQSKLPDGRTQMSPASEYPVTVWELSDPKVVWSATAEGSWTSAVGYSTDGSRVAAIAAPGPNKPVAVRFWEAATGKDVGQIELPQHGSRFAFDRSGKRLAVTLRDTTSMVYDVEAALQSARAK